MAKGKSEASEAVAEGFFGAIRLIANRIGRIVSEPGRSSQASPGPDRGHGGREGAPGDCSRFNYGGFAKVDPDEILALAKYLSRPRGLGLPVLLTDLSLGVAS